MDQPIMVASAGRGRPPMKSALVVCLGCLSALAAVAKKSTFVTSAEVGYSAKFKPRDGFL